MMWWKLTYSSSPLHSAEMKIRPRSFVQLLAMRTVSRKKEPKSKNLQDPARILQDARSLQEHEKNLQNSNVLARS